TGTITGIKNGDDITASYATAADQHSGVGGYPIVPTAVDATPAKLANYDITLVNATLTVGKAPLTLTADNQSKTYGDANPGLTFSVDGLVNGDTRATALTADPALATTAD